MGEGKGLSVEGSRKGEGEQTGAALTHFKTCGAKEILSNILAITTYIHEAGQNI